MNLILYFYTFEITDDEFAFLVSIVVGAAIDTTLILTVQAYQDQLGNTAWRQLSQQNALHKDLKRILWSKFGEGGPKVVNTSWVI